MKAPVDNHILGDQLLSIRLGALAHPARLRILKHLSGHPACCCKDVVECLDLAQSTVSQHLKILVDAGLVTYRPERPRSLYQIDRAALSGMSESLSGLVQTCCADHAAAREVSLEKSLGQ